MWEFVLGGAIVAFTMLYMYTRKKMSFWRNQGVAEDPGYFPFGSQGTWDFITQKIAISQISEGAYTSHPDALVVGTYGFFGQPSIVIRDLDIAKLILVKDFDQFSERKPAGNDPYSPHTKNNKYLRKMLTELRGKEWKRTRSSLSPIFTSGKLKAMVPLIHNVADKCNDYLDGLCGQDIEGKELMTRFALDVIISTGFGYEADSFKDPDNVFKKNADLMISKKMTFKMMMIFVFFMFAPKILRLLDTPVLNPEAERFFANLVLQSMEERRKSKTRRNDLIDLVIDVMNKGEGKVSNSGDEGADFTMEELEEILISNSILMFLAGFDTVSTTTGIMLYNMAKNPECQEKLYQEISKAVELNGGDEHLDYASIMGMEYMEMSFQESLRHYPFGHLERASKNDYKIPGMDIVIPKDIYVRIPVAAIVKDEKYFENPKKFEPENFNAEKKAERHQFATGSFGHGPRNCIAQRFATLEVKIAIARILYRYKVLSCEKTVDELIPDPKSRSLQPKGEVFFTVQKR